MDWMSLVSGDIIKMDTGKLDLTEFLFGEDEVRVLLNEILVLLLFVRLLIPFRNNCFFK